MGLNPGRDGQAGKTTLEVLCIPRSAPSGARAVTEAGSDCGEAKTRRSPGSTRAGWRDCVLSDFMLKSRSGSAGGSGAHGGSSVHTTENRRQTYFPKALVVKHWSLPKGI